MLLQSVDSELTLRYAMKSEALLDLFPDKKDPQNIYSILMEMGKTLPVLPDRCKTTENLVQGCQSLVYLAAELSQEGLISFRIQSDALISSGLAALLLFVYNLEKPELLLSRSPLFIKDLGLINNLSPGRSNGLASIHARMKTEALKLILTRKELEVLNKK